MFTELNNNATASKAQSRKQGYSAMTMVGEGEKSIDAAVTTAEAGLALFSKHVEKWGWIMSKFSYMVTPHT